MSKVKIHSCTRAHTNPTHLLGARGTFAAHCAQVSLACLLLAKVPLCALLCKDLPVPIHSHPTKKDPVLLPALLCATQRTRARVHARPWVCTPLALPLCASNAARATLCSPTPPARSPLARNKTASLVRTTSLPSSRCMQVHPCLSCLCVCLCSKCVCARARVCTRGSKSKWPFHQPLCSAAPTRKPPRAGRSLP